MSRRQSADRETFDSLQDQHGEDPARWLDRDLDRRQATRPSYYENAKG